MAAIPRQLSLWRYWLHGGVDYGQLGGKRDLARVLSLRCRRARDRAQAAQAHAVQLLHLPALRRAVGVLLAQWCAPGAGAALAGEVRAGGTDARVLALQDLRLRDSPPAPARHEHRRERTQ